MNLKPLQILQKKQKTKQLPYKHIYKYTYIHIYIYKYFPFKWKFIVNIYICRNKNRLNHLLVWLDSNTSKERNKQVRRLPSTFGIKRTKY